MSAEQPGAPGSGAPVPVTPHAVVTGVSSGIGRAITRRLLDAGWAVTGLSRRDPGLPDPSFTWIAADLTDVPTIPGLVETVGRLDAVVHAAGYMTTGHLGDLDPAALRGMLALHVEAPSALVDALEARLNDGGRIVLVGSRTMTGVAGKSHYAASKSALAGLTRSWAMELAPRGITCNVVAPGPTDTPMLSDPGRASVPPKVPALGRLVAPEEIAELVALLVGPHGGSMTGQTLTVCGGASL
ncbi:SDR family NAD(P)-dependent oxidoreductase [Zhihengliuella salsuginis]|uniref:NAD(P)-dependent dehydrogenase, short-chain alcohol dehydrogenase family n=1 Tax=Zhihengliuella salsuginis TaxID=578222 RepID=A0ABQ3GGX5_9MICC|nr:SDR family oxidoreductase [Zhihengliuella salsuginis]GHD06033.1 hypothetical protein GCM10008096_15540 [Zhihengliuella salsuginis]